MANKSVKTDRRVSRTRAALRQALVELSRERGYDAVTVEELTARANVGRTTFYLHYRDKEELLLEEFSELLNERLVAQFLDFPLSAWRLAPAGGQQPPFRPVLAIFQHVQENGELYRIVWRAESAGKINKQLRSIIMDAIQRVVQRGREELPNLALPVPLDLLASYVAGGLLAAVGWWLETGTDFTPEQMTHIFQRIYFPGFTELAAE